jgi:putative transposase
MMIPMTDPEAPPLPDARESLHGTRDWPHAPPHRLGSAGVYFVTARTRNAVPLLSDAQRRDCFQTVLFELSGIYQWKLEAWAILSNHYHLIAHSRPDQNDGAMGLSCFIKHLHSQATKELNRLDKTPGRTRLWQNFRETHLTLQRGYLARLNYVHHNPVHHGLVPLASQWPWCSAAAFERAVTPAWHATVARFRYDRIALADGE